MYRVKQVLLFLLVSAIYSKVHADTFPGASWTHHPDPSTVGFYGEKLEDAKAYAEKIGSAAVLVIVDGKVLVDWGETARKFKSHSIRKSFLSALYGNYVVDQVIDLDTTLADLNIQDQPPLTPEELRATVRDCLKARSGIYHTALYESQRMKALKPDRHTHRPGTHWYYNNYDFNVAGTIFMRLTGKDFYEAVESDIAKPIGMEQFIAADGAYVSGDESMHNAYPFRINSYDLARFGWLMLNKGAWNGVQVVPEIWVEESTRYHSDASLYGSDGYGYMWWVARDHNKYPHLENLSVPEGSYSAQGSGGHVMLVIPSLNTVLVHRANTDTEGQRISYDEVGKIFSLILRARDDVVTQR